MNKWHLHWKGRNNTLFMDGMTLFIITQKESIKKLLEIRKEFSKIIGHNQYTKIAFLKIGNKCSKNKMQKTILFK